ncbi:hypothetical protein [Palleronia caenipelagi]|uniref:Uncharacterized protein n=1 Tax=Palleronia caenipelagi TaxID=2489174 RepID=A0A547PT94_9RHOB|nr:hypothetical protein [Palleronia caenipelagi]TRD17301.1 hypothetical protein FEV53_13285 [Palleronia caenipelagi]
MLRQYEPQRFRDQVIRGKTCRVGTVDVGSIRIVGGVKVMVEGWIPRDYACHINGRFVTKRIRGGHLAQIRVLRTGQKKILADHYLVNADEIHG